jgi:CRP-like cAMP-binding protein
MDIINAFIKDIIPFLRKPDDIIIEQGTEAYHFYFIAEGSCEVTMIDYKNNQAKSMCRELNQGNYFGEIGLIFNCKRTATVKSTNYCTFARIHKKVFLNTSKAF